MFTSDDFIRRMQRYPENHSENMRWRVLGDDYIVLPADKIADKPEYRIVESAAYHSWLGFETRHMYALRREDNGSG